MAHISGALADSCLASKLLCQSLSELSLSRRTHLGSLQSSKASCYTTGRCDRMAQYANLPKSTGCAQTNFLVRDCAVDLMANSVAGFERIFSKPTD